MGGKAGRSTHENRGSWCGREGPAVAVGMGAERTSMVHGELAMSSRGSSTEADLDWSKQAKLRFAKQ